MPLPPLDQYGLLPEGIYTSTLAEAQARFVFNPHRQHLWNNLIELLRELHRSDMAYPIWLGGGFITNKANPSDIDLVHDLTGACGYNQYRGFKLFKDQRAAIKQTHQIDYLVNIAGQNDFSSFLQYIGPTSAALTGLNEKHTRGILRIESRTWLDGLNK